MIQIKRIFLVLMAVMIFTFTTLAMTAPPAHAVVGPALKIVGGEALDQVMQGMAYKLGQSFNDESSLDKARGRWNLEGYEKAKAYETQMNAEEKARWDKFNSEVSNAKPTPIPSKPGFGKILLSGAAFLTGADIIYNSYKAFQVGATGSGQMEIAEYESVVSPTKHPGVSLSYTLVPNPHGIDSRWDEAFGTLTIRTADGQIIKKDNLNLGYRYMGPFTYVVSGNRVTIVSNTGGETNGHSYTYPSISTDLGVPKMNTVPVTATDTAVNVPDAFADVPRVAEVPDISSIREINPDSVVEIIVPLDPGINPTPFEIPPLTKEELDHIRGTEPETDPGKPPGDDTDPNKPPGDNPDAPPGDNPFPDMEKPPIETPEYPEEVTDPEGTPTGGLFSKLFEWLKALLDALFKILNAILAIPALIINALKALLLVLFVPSDGFWNDNVNDVRKVVTDELDPDDLLDEVDNLGGVSGGQFKDVIVSLMGVDNLEVIDADSVNRVLDFIHKFVRGVVFPFLIFYNINQLYKLIRGTSLVEATRNLNRMKGE